MKKIILISFIIFLSNCVGYKPIFTSGQVNFYINKIEISDDNKLTRKLIKNYLIDTYNGKKLNLQSNGRSGGTTNLYFENGKQSIALKLDLNKQENVIMKDAKGDPASYEIKIELNVDVITKESIKKLNFRENFTFNNQSNKFELNQYKNNTETNLINKIFENLILELRTI
jgi:hypothetical protein